MDGVALIEAARRHRRDLPAILLTGHAQDNARLNGGQDCAYTLLTKPVRASELVARIAASLNQSSDKGEGTPQGALAA